MIDGTWRFALGAMVCKTKGSNWHGKVVGFYSTSLTPRGYCVESDTEKGSVQIYPEAALTLFVRADTEKQCGWLQFHPDHAPKGDLQTQSLTEADRLAGWVQEPIYRKVG